MKNQVTPRIYVACLAAYNNGVLHGRWIDANQTPADIHAEIKVMLKESPERFAEEWAVHDYEGFGEIHLSEWPEIERVAELARLIDEHGDVFTVWYQTQDAQHLAIHELNENFLTQWNGEHDSERAFVEELLESTSQLSAIPEWARGYFDFEGYARDLRLSGAYSFIRHEGQVCVFSNQSRAAHSAVPLYGGDFMETTSKPSHRVRYRWTEDDKTNRAARDLQLAVQKILGAHQLLESFRESSHFFARIEIPGHLPLTICKDGRNLTIANYFRRDGEQEADPAMDLEIGAGGDWYPIHVHLADDYYSCIDGPLFIDCEMRRKQVSFAAKWAVDLLTSGYEAGEVTQLSGQIERKNQTKGHMK